MVKQYLDNGPFRRPTKPDTESRSSSDMDFKKIIAKGENPNGQTSISPAEVSRGGQTSGRGYSSWHWGNNTDGERFNGNPMLNKGDSYDIMPFMGTPKKK